jgi:hypothetical protein
MWSQTDLTNPQDVPIGWTLCFAMFVHVVEIRLSV